MGGNTKEFKKKKQRMMSKGYHDSISLKNMYAQCVFQVDRAFPTPLLDDNDLSTVPAQGSCPALVEAGSTTNGQDGSENLIRRQPTHTGLWSGLKGWFWPTGTMIITETARLAPSEVKSTSSRPSWFVGRERSQGSCTESRQAMITGMRC